MRFLACRRLDGSGVRTQLVAGQGICNITTLTSGCSPLLKTSPFPVSAFAIAFLITSFLLCRPSVCSLKSVVLCPLPAKCGPTSLCLSNLSPATCATLGSYSSVCPAVHKHCAITLHHNIIYYPITVPSTMTPSLTPTGQPLTSTPSRTPTSTPSLTPTSTPSLTPTSTPAASPSTAAPSSSPVTVQPAPVRHRFSDYDKNTYY